MSRATVRERPIPPHSCRSHELWVWQQRRSLTAVTTPDGRVTALMPLVERVFRNAQMSWAAGDVSARSPWSRMFGYARRWLG